MNNEIKLLDAATINRIAAGEVIERPASVVKELVENSIDAGATAVTIEADAGGKSLIRVTDNGSGIAKGQVRLAFLKHSTSKISGSEDLEGISTLGFRGEALSSIAAIAKVELTTKTRDELSGVRYVIEDGKEKSLQETGAPDGTTFLVKNIFGHVPVRKKFLAGDQTEAAYIIDITEKIALAHPEVSIKLILNGKLRFLTSGNGKLIDVIYSVLGRETAADMLPIRAESSNIRITGYAGRPSASRASRSYEIYSINGRYIKSRVITGAIEEAYAGHLMQHRFPAAVLKLELPPSSVDVNVHPAKLEVRFEDEKAVYRFVRDAVRAALAGGELISEMTFGDGAENKNTTAKTCETVHGNAGGTSPAVSDEKPGDVPETEKAEVPTGSIVKKTENTVIIDGKTEITEADTVPDGKDSPGDEQKEYPITKADTTDISVKEEKDLYSGEQQKLPDRLLSEPNRYKFRLLGIAFDTYLLVQYEDRFLMIDQHAAHEKVMYERMLKEFEAGTVSSQRCMPPLIVTLTAKEELAVRENIDELASMGFEIEHFGGREWQVYAVPSNLLSLAKEDVFTELVDLLGNSAEARSGNLIRERIAKLACKAAVKGSDRLSVPEAETLITELLSCRNPYTCPHGRPTVISMSLQELEKKFKRIVQ